MNYRKTLQKDIFFEGIGLHTSNHCGVRVTPAPHGTGIMFVVREHSIPVDAQSLEGSSLGTNIVWDGGCVRTVEHLLSALCSTGVTDAFVVTDSSEIPILDGSAIDFVNGISSVGTRKLENQKFMKVPCTIELSEGDKAIKLTPRADDTILINFEINFQNKVVSEMPQTLSYMHNCENFFDYIASARTFGFKSDLEQLLSMNLCLGGSLENAILIDDDRIINVNGLRFENELVAHKVLDLIGDLSPILSSYNGFELNACQAGHGINNKFLKHFTDVVSSYE